MRTGRTTSISDLREAIDCLPRHTRIAMLRGIEHNPIVVGAYTHDGGVCPMLAAHRCGGRTDFIGFARAWDRFAFRGRSAEARSATARELTVLRVHLEMSLLAEEVPAVSVAEAIADHRRLAADRDERSGRRGVRSGDAPDRPAGWPLPAAQGAERLRPGDPDRSGELSRHGGWAWTPPFRRLDDYERALERLRDAAAAGEEAAAERFLALR